MGSGTGASDETIGVGVGFGDRAAHTLKHGLFVSGQGVVDGAMFGREERVDKFDGVKQGHVDTLPAERRHDVCGVADEGEIVVCGPALRDGHGVEGPV